MKGKVITKTLVVGEKTKEMMVDYFLEFKREKTPPYAIFQADDGDTVVTLYESGKAVFQGKDGGGLRCGRRGRGAEPCVPWPH